MAAKVDKTGTGQYEGSQAFVHVISGQNDFITLSTGSLNFFQPLVNLRGKRSSINFEFSLSYTDGTLGTFGLPDNWGFSVAYLFLKKTLTIDGRTHIIEFSWADSTGYQSGLKFILRYANPSKRRAEHAYKLQTSDGSAYYFDVQGKLWEQNDLFENHIYYSFAEAEDSDVLNTAQGRIEDSWGQLVSFEYEPSSESPYANMIITMPDGGKAGITRTDGGVGIIKDPTGLETNFAYFTREKTLIEIGYATGLTSGFKYTQLEYKDSMMRLDTSMLSRITTAVTELEM